MADQDRTNDSRENDDLEETLADGEVRGGNGVAADDDNPELRGRPHDLAHFLWEVVKVRGGDVEHWVVIARDPWTNYLRHCWATDARTLEELNQEVHPWLGRARPVVTDNGPRYGTPIALVADDDLVAGGGDDPVHTDDAGPEARR